jgi:hypothetical protein
VLDTLPSKLVAPAVELRLNQSPELIVGNVLCHERPDLFSGHTSGKNVAGQVTCNDGTRSENRVRSNRDARQNGNVEAEPYIGLNADPLEGGIVAIRESVPEVKPVGPHG